MDMIPVTSDAVTHIGHDGQHLHVTYKGGKTYIHPDVPQDKFTQLMQADSKGKFIAAHIRVQHPVAL
jgi:KTSC domain